jgi:hypothetical protein
MDISCHKICGFMLCVVLLVPLDKIRISVPNYEKIIQMHGQEIPDTERSLIIANRCSV